MARLSMSAWDDLENVVPLRADLPLLWFDDIEPVLDAQDFVQGLLLTGGAVVVYGQSNSGKTFWVTDLSLHVAAGKAWQGRRVEQGGVIYCVLEGGFGFRNRVAAWKAAHGAGSIPFAAIPASVNLLDPEADTDLLIAAVRAASAQMGVDIKLIVVDTLARALAGGNENASEDMGALVMNMDKIRSKTGAAVLFVHHSGKDETKGSRGHSSLRGAVDTEIEVVADDAGDGRSAEVKKQREMQKGAIFPFTLRVVELGHNRHGEPVTTCIVEPGDENAPRSAPAKRRLKGHQLRAYEVLADLLAGSGKEGSPGVPPGVSSVPEKWWRDRFFERAMPGSDYEARQKGFKRAATELVNDHVVGLGRDRVWIAYPIQDRNDPGQNGHFGGQKRTFPGEIPNEDETT